MKKGVLLLSFLLSAFFILAQTQATLQGKVTDVKSGEDMIDAYVVLKKGGVSKTVVTDFEGNYSASVDPGTYEVEVTYTGMARSLIQGVVLNAGRITKLDIKMKEGDVLKAVDIIAYKVPLVQADNTTSGNIVTSEQIAKLPTRNVSAIVGTTAGVNVNRDGEVTIKGARKEGTVYIVDGVRIQGSAGAPPAQDIDQLQVITGGIEAQYGDLTGGVVSITTKGPAAKLSGGIEVETSKKLDPYDNNLVNANLSGPIIRKNNQTVLGFRVSGNYSNNKDGAPSAVGAAYIKPEKLAELEANPISRLGQTFVSSAESVKESDVQRLKYRPFERDVRYDGTAKLDARLNKNIDVTLSGAYVNQHNQFTPDQTGVNPDRKWILLNAQRNPFEDVTRARGNFRFRHRLGSSTTADGKASTALIQNAQYTLQAGYENYQRTRQDQIHKDNFFNYGYIGEFKDSVARVFNLVPDTSGGVFFRHEGNRIDFAGYKSGDANPVLANYNNLFTDQSRADLFPNRNGFFGDTYQDAWTNRNVGRIYNVFLKDNNDWFTGNVNTSFDIVPGGASKGRHNVQVGLIYEQRTERQYDLRPSALWDIGGLLVDQHFNGLADGAVISVDGKNITKPLNIIGKRTQTNPITGTPQEVDVYGYYSVPDAQSKFYKEVRKLTNTPIDQHFNMNAVKPGDLNLGMFSAREITSRVGALNYYGYDYTGKVLAPGTTFEDFFTAVDADGIRTLPVAAFTPLYTAGYIQDKFSYKDIIFRIGLRVDRFDANTKVMKDPYSLYEITTADAFFANNATAVRPGTIGDDFAVYVNDADASIKTVKAFRSGDQWFDAKGTTVNDANTIFNGAVPKPLYTNSAATKNNDYIKELNFDPNSSFTDYKPQLNLMPRLAFSFPISDDANFYANYDVLVSRPTSGFRATAMDYFYFLDAGRFDVTTPIENAALKPERTIYYEAGFQQKLTNSSAIKITAYYKELRDMIQRRTYFYVPIVNTYNTYGNIDFGTVKGFTFGYDLRRTGNVSANINYTLQYADATGSDQNSQRGLTSRGNLRTIYPTSFDERHNLQASVDFRYDSGDKYNGPVIAGKNILESFGVNLLMNAISGTPYTAKLVPDKLAGSGTVGDINGARLPWKYNLDLRVDKTFSFGRADKKSTYNIFFRVQNILDTRNVLGVFPYSGSATDDGYLNSSFGRQEIESIRAQGRDLQAFQDAYRWALLDGGNFSLPRRVFLGMSFYF